MSYLVIQSLGSGTWYLARVLSRPYLFKWMDRESEATRFTMEDAIAAFLMIDIPQATIVRRRYHDHGD